jgi:hypothetical protein
LVVLSDCERQASREVQHHLMAEDPDFARSFNEAGRRDSTYSVQAISFLETPLTFRAPGITAPLGFDIGRLVFRALAAAELALTVALTAALALDNRGGVVAVGLVGLLWLVLAAQVSVLRPRLDRRARIIVAGGIPPRSRLHLTHPARDALKVVTLPVLGSVLVIEIAS